MTENKKTIVTAEKIADFLKQTGFVFEMRMHEIFAKNGYTCDINSSFHDLEGDTEREIDIVAIKRFDNEIIVHFVVECKQSALDKWIFICTQTDSPRFYYAVKHLPTIPIEILKGQKVFDPLHTFRKDLLLGRNYISYSVATNKKTDHLQIDGCVYKLPKALVDVASRTTEAGISFFPSHYSPANCFQSTTTGL